MNISYKDHATNEEVQRRIQAVIGDYDDPGQETGTKWFSHISSHISRSSGLAKMILQGTVKGNRRRGRQIKRLEDNNIERTGMDFASSTGAAENRTRWKGIVAKIHLPSKVRN